MKKALIAITALTASALIAGCANVPREAHRINLITLDEAEANHCKSLGWVGSVSVLLINGKARNTAVILKKAVKMPGATHIAYTKGEAGYATTRAQVLSCPNPNLKTKDPETMLISANTSSTTNAGINLLDRFRDSSALSGLSTI